MAFVRNLLSILMVCISYQAVAYPHNGEAGLLQIEQGGFLQDMEDPSASVRSFSKLSTSCQLAASSLLFGDFGTCANLLGLVSSFETRESLVSPINTWVSETCSLSACDQAGLAVASETIASGCRADLDEQSVAAVTIYSIITHYNATRDMFCTQNKQDGRFCLPSVLENVEARSGEKITVSGVISLISGKLTRADRAFLSIPKETYCTDCTHAIVSQSAAMIDAIRRDPAGIRFDYKPNQAVHRIADVCGASFEDGVLPPTVTIAKPNSDLAMDMSESTILREIPYEFAQN
ncbi:hypothetical protein PCASD_19726 [Puccinia coronata f. sp. avenae]|uniref:DUF7729 domain-containing protein n=1 Tax=Puccinia coronata f. sp. avenae TaxID=200324 RepID=A0A2N5T465_9BASI|nr:hypothetical protein PCASD_19726 [Puccinia coronata f. sp. avenae]